jgi:hypothetical protein
MKKHKLAIGIFGLLLFLFMTWFFYFRTARENRLTREGNELVKKIEYYRAEHKILPNSLEEIGIPEMDGFNVLYYYKRDSLHYTVSFAISAEEHNFYYSDTKQWEKGFRAIKK